MGAGYLELVEHIAHDDDAGPQGWLWWGSSGKAHRAGPVGGLFRGHLDCI